MAGHSQFANIKHKKEREDSKRAKTFTKLAREISIAVREGGKDQNSNPRLRISIKKAKDSNMPKENIDRAIKRGCGELENELLEEIRYEGYGIGGVAIIVNASTDNKNRTASELRYIFSRNKGTLGETGSVIWSFKKIGVIEIDKENLIEEDVIEFGINNGAEDFEVLDNKYIIKCNFNLFYDFLDKLEKKFKVIDSFIFMEATNTISLAETEREEVLNLIKMLEESDDVQDVYSNLEI